MKTFKFIYEDTEYTGPGDNWPVQSLIEAEHLFNDEVTWPNVLKDLLAVDKAGKWRRKTSLLLVARQNGKTHLARIRILAGLFVFGEKNIVAMSSNRGMALDKSDTAYGIGADEA